MRTPLISITQGISHHSPFNASFFAIVSRSVLDAIFVGVVRVELFDEDAIAAPMDDVPIAELRIVFDGADGIEEKAGESLAGLDRFKAIAFKDVIAVNVLQPCEQPDGIGIDFEAERKVETVEGADGDVIAAMNEIADDHVAVESFAAKFDLRHDGIPLSGLDEIFF